MNTSYSMNNYLQHQSHKSHNLFEGTSKLEDLVPPTHQTQAEVRQELKQVERWLTQSRANIEQAIARAKVAQYLDDSPDKLPAAAIRFR